jgi:hypothetical protein
MLFVIRQGRRSCGKLQSFFSVAIAPDPFLRKAPLALTASGSAALRQMLICLVRIPH